MPAGARVVPHGNSTRDLTMWFVHSPDALMRGIASMKTHAASGALWILWNKSSPAGEASRLTQQVVRKAGLDIGLVDFKITRIDEDWAGLRFTIRKR